MGIGKFFRNIGVLSRTDLPNEEQRSGWFMSFLNTLGGFYFSHNNKEVKIGDSKASAMRISTVFTCVLVRGESLSTLPASVKQATESGSRTAYESPVHRLIHDRPNPFQTAADFWKTVSAHIDLCGNCFAIIKYSGKMQPKRLDIISDPNAVEVKESESGDAFYEYNGKTYASYEMLHFKDLSLDGYYGCSKISYNRDTLNYANKLRNFGENAIDERPSGYFSTEQTFDVVKKQGDNLSNSWTTAIANGKMPVLPFGLKYNLVGVNPNDAQYLDSIEATKEDIYGMFRVPPSLAQNYQRATFSNAEQQDMVFVKYTLMPLVTNIEQECNSKLFPESNNTSKTPYYVKFNFGALLRGDFRTRTEGYRTLFNIGAINGDTIADLEDWNKWEGGDKRFVPMNLIDITKVDEFTDKLTQPINSNSSDPGGDPTQKRDNDLSGIIYRNGNKNGHVKHEN